MAMEAIKSAAATYQGSASTAAVRTPLKLVRPKSDPSMENISTSASDQVEDFSTDERVAAVEPRSNGDQGSKQEQAKDQEPILGGKNNKQLQEAVEKMKEKMQEQTEAVFGFHEGTNRVMIKIVDKTTKDVIKEYPPEETLDMIQKVWEMAGIIVDDKR